MAEAREAGAPTRSPEAFKRAEEHLRQAEALERARGARDRRGAQRAADLALAEARLRDGARARALRQTEQTTTKAAAQAAASPAEVDRLTARIKKAEDDQHRLEEQIARPHPRPRGHGDGADPHQGAAEGERDQGGGLRRHRGGAHPGRPPGRGQDRASTSARSEESLAKAEEQLSAGNFGAALFFASKAQDSCTRSTQETPR